MSLKDSIEFEDPISLAPIYCAFDLNKSNTGNTYSKPIINIIHQICNIDHLNCLSLSSNDPKLRHNLGSEIKISDAIVRVPYLNGSWIQLLNR